MTVVTDAMAAIPEPRGNIGRKEDWSQEAITVAMK